MTHSEFSHRPQWPVETADFANRCADTGREWRLNPMSRSDTPQASGADIAGLEALEDALSALVARLAEARKSLGMTAGAEAVQLRVVPSESMSDDDAAPGQVAAWFSPDVVRLLAAHLQTSLGTTPGTDVHPDTTALRGILDDLETRVQQLETLLGGVGGILRLLSK